MICMSKLHIFILNIYLPIKLLNSLKRFEKHKKNRHPSCIFFIYYTKCYTKNCWSMMKKMRVYLLAQLSASDFLKLIFDN